MIEDEISKEIGQLEDRVMTRLVAAFDAGRLPVKLGVTDLVRRYVELLEVLESGEYVDES